MSEVVVVSGVGIVSALGDSGMTMRALFAGESGVRPLSLFPTQDYATHWAAEVPASALPTEPTSPHVLSRSDRFALAAAREALTRASVTETRDVELLVACSVGGMFETELPLTLLHRGDNVQEEAGLFVCHPPSAPADRLQERLGPFASVRTVTSACSSGAVAIAIAMSRLRRGAAKRVLVGGTDALSVLTFAGFSALRSLDPEGARPFHKARMGLTLGECSAFLLLELGSSKNRVTLAGAHVACEAHHITQPEESGRTAEAVMRAALSDAGASPDAVAYVNAHGTGTPLNDAMELSAIRRVVDDRPVYVSSQKGQLGHTLAASGALQAAVTSLSLGAGRVLPAGCAQADADPALGPLLLGKPGELLPEGENRVALSNAFGFGGTSATLVFQRGGSHPSNTREQPSLSITACAVTGAGGLMLGADAAQVLDDAVLPAPPARDEARRLDEQSRIAVALGRALSPSLSNGAAVVASTAFGSPDDAAAFSLKVLTKGPRLAPPQDFPNLLPSAPASHTSIALGLHGPSLSASDLGAGGVAALSTAVDVLLSGWAPEALVVAVEAKSRLGEAVLTPALSGQAGAREAGGGAVVVSTSPALRLAGLALATVARGDLPVPVFQEFEVFTTHDDARIAAWALAHGVTARVQVLPPQLGVHEARGAMLLAAVVAKIAKGEVSRAVVFSPAPDRVGVVWLER